MSFRVSNPAARRHSAGFTLIEVLVVAAMIALATGSMLVGYNIVFSRQLDSEAEKMNDWFQAVAESAVFQSSVLGVRAEENVFEVVAYYDSRWYLLNGYEPYELADDMHWEVETAEKIEFGQSTEEEDQVREPFVAFLPSGQALPEGKLSVHSGTESATLIWDENADFGLDTGEEES